MFFQLDGATGKLSSDEPITQEVTLHVFGQPFARGGYRNVYWAVVEGEKYVAKRYIGQTSTTSMGVVEQVRSAGEFLKSPSKHDTLESAAQIEISCKFS